MNRIAAAIDRMQDRIDRGVKPDGSPITANLVEFEKSMDNTLREHTQYQNLQAVAHSSGILSAEEAQTVYMALGEVPASNGWATGTTLATKVVVTQIMSELLGVGHAGRSRR